jgi:hypothetical protein
MARLVVFIISSFLSNKMLVSKEVTFQGYKISAHAMQYLDDYWVGDYEITQDGWHIRTSKSVAFHASEAGAQADALAMGIRYLTECLLPVVALRAKALRFRR